MANLELKGHIYKIRDRGQFFGSYFQNPAGPTQGSFTPASGLKVYLTWLEVPKLEDIIRLIITNPRNAYAVLTGAVEKFIPDPSVRTTTSDSGAFKFVYPEAFGVAAAMAKKAARLVAYRVLDSRPIPLLGPVYRSQWFNVGDACRSGHEIYYEAVSAKDGEHLAASDLASMLTEFRSLVKKLNVVVKDGGLSVHASVRKGGKEAKVDVSVDLRPSTSGTLSSLLSGEVTDINVDLPGLDVATLTALSVGDAFGSNKADKARTAIHDIPDMVSDGVKAALARVSSGFVSGLVTEVARQMNVGESVVRTFLDGHAAITAQRLHWPKVGEVDLKFMKVPIRGMAMDWSLGIPQKLT